MYRRSEFDTPYRMYNQHFGNGLLNQELIHHPVCPASSSSHHQACAPWSAMSQQHDQRPRRVHNAQESGCSEIQCNKDKLELKLDVHQFAPEEVTVKTLEDNGKWIIVEGHHEEKSDAHGLISRTFKRKYAVPEDAQHEDIHCNLSSDGVLVVSIKRVPAIKDKDSKERLHTIHATGTPDHQFGHNKPVCDKAGKHCDKNNMQQNGAASDKKDAKKEEIK
jgi:HSP20 family molecular chaperone IbpA